MEIFEANIFFVKGGAPVKWLQNINHQHMNILH